MFMRNNDIKNLAFEISMFSKKHNLNVCDEYKEMVDLEQVIGVLLKISAEMEKRILKEKEEPYVTDVVERNFMQFACDCMNYILNQYENDLNQNNIRKELVESLNKLFGCRHFGYAFFVVIDDEYYQYKRTELYSLLEDVNKYYLLDEEKQRELLNVYGAFYKQAYLSLAKFYEKFFGRFSDNERAIRLLCKYFDKNLMFDEAEQTAIIDGLITHIGNAGEPNDYGYAYNGIEIIRRCINNFPYYMVDKLLNRYMCHEIEERIVSRKQIFAIINNTIPKEKLNQYKFLFLDSILIMNMLKDIYNEERKKLGESVINYYLVREMSIKEDSIAITDSIGNEYQWLADSENIKRAFKRVNGETIFEVCLEEPLNENKISVMYGGSKYVLKNRLDLNGILSVYDKQYFLELKESLIERRDNNYISYKFVHLNNYHGIKRQEFCFDKRFGYKDGVITFDGNNIEKKPLIYSTYITSIHAIVGKNGTGKTSLVNFLGNDFVNIMFKLEEENVKISNIIESMKMQDFEFVVVFEMDDRFYYVSNIEFLQVPKEMKKYNPTIDGSIKRALSKAFYFSNKIDINEAFEPRKKEKNEVGKRLEVCGTNDYSEQRALHQRINWHTDVNYYEIQAMEKKRGGFFNIELFIQLIFLRDHFDNDGKNLKNMLWDDFSVDKLTLEDNEKDKIIHEFIKEHESKVQELQGVFSIERNLKYFSSGQYAKLNFLAKLYWIVKGYANNREIIKELGEQNRFYGEDVIGESDSAIVFIDEGDLYYHPDWQRRYISDLCKIIEEAVNCKLQIIIATNSPFILSDIFKDNITFISEEDKIVKTHDNTFGQNIHTLLKNDFFMDYTIGEFAREKIVKIFGILEGPQGNEDEGSEDQQDITIEELADKVSEVLGFTVLPEQVYEQLYLFANSIGESMYRRHMISLIEEHMKNDKDIRVNYLRMRQKEIEEELQKLEREFSYDKNEEI